MCDHLNPSSSFLRQDSGVTERMTQKKSAIDAEIAELKRIQAANYADDVGTQPAFGPDLAELKKLQLANHAGDSSAALAPAPATCKRNLRSCS